MGINIGQLATIDACMQALSPPQATTGVGWNQPLSRDAALLPAHVRAVAFIVYRSGRRTVWKIYLSASPMVDSHTGQAWAPLTMRSSAGCLFLRSSE